MATRWTFGKGTGGTAPIPTPTLPQSKTPKNSLRYDYESYPGARITSKKGNTTNYALPGWGNVTMVNKSPAAGMMGFGNPLLDVITPKKYNPDYVPVLSRHNPTPPLTWEETYSTKFAPKWWKGKTPSQMNEQTKYVALMNSLIPYLSPEDQRTFASNLYRNYSNVFPEYNPEVNQYPVPPSEVTTEMRNRFTTKERASDAMDTLTRIAGITKQTDETMGSGYKFLRNLLKVMQDFGGESSSNQQTREQYLQQLGALDPLMGEAGSDAIAPYESIVQSLTSPYFTAGKTVPIQKTSDGRYIFGEGNRQLY